MIENAMKAVFLTDRVLAPRQKCGRESTIPECVEKCRSTGCDLFGIVEQLQKFENRRYEELKADALKNAIVQVSVRFQNVR